MRSSPLLSCVLETVAPAAPSGVQTQAPPAQRPSLRRGNAPLLAATSYPGTSRGISGFSKIGPGHRVAQPSNPLPRAPGVERTQIVGGHPPPSRFHASITPGRGPRGHWRPVPDTLAPSPQTRSSQPCSNAPGRRLPVLFSGPDSRSRRWGRGACGTRRPPGRWSPRREALLHRQWRLAIPPSSPWGRTFSPPSPAAGLLPQPS